MVPQDISVPIWLVSVLTSVIGAGFVVWGGVSFLKGEVKRISGEQCRNMNDITELWEEIGKLRTEKVSRDEFAQTMARLDRIESKLDDLIRSK
jgi:hypothetical protein